MSDEGSHRRHEGGLHEGPARAAPYPLSRMAPPHDLVDVAREIQRADAVLGTVTGTKLKVIADQIRALQEQAREVLTRARRDADLHRARCRFEKRAGQVYHLYRRDDGELWFSLLAPEEWSLPQPQTFVGSYRLEVDMSWTPVAEVPQRDEENEAVAKLLAAENLPGGGGG